MIADANNDKKPADDLENGRPASRVSVGTSQGSISRHAPAYQENGPKATRRGTNNTTDDEDDDVDEDVDEHAFDHPSTYKPAPCVWVPKDTLGLSDIILNELREAGVDASSQGAAMNEKARVKVS